MDLGNVGPCDKKTTQSDSDTSNDISAIGKEQAKRDQTDWEHGIVGKELMNGRVAREMTEARKEARRTPRAANPIGTTTTTREARGAKGKARTNARARVKPDVLRLRRARAHRIELPVQVGQQHGRRWEMIKHHRGRVSLKEGMLKNSLAWRRPTTKENGAGPGETLDGAGGLIRDEHSAASLKMLEVGERLED